MKIMTFEMACSSLIFSLSSDPSVKACSIQLTDHINKLAILVCRVIVVDCGTDLSEIYVNEAEAVFELGDREKMMTNAGPSMSI